MLEGSQGPVVKRHGVPGESVEEVLRQLKLSRPQRSLCPVMVPVESPSVEPLDRLGVDRGGARLVGSVVIALSAAGMNLSQRRWKL